MAKQSFMIDKLYNDILMELQALYAMIGVNKLTYDHDEYIKGINKLVAVGAALDLETGGVTNG